MASAAAAPKNLLVFVRDQVQTQWLPESWQKDHLVTSEWLRNNGLSFSNAYSNTSMCTSSRATFFTGKFPAQHQVKILLDENNLGNEIIQNQIQLDPQLPNLASIFNEEGYDSVYFGKNHIQKALHLEEMQDASGNVIRPASIAYQNLNEFGFGDGTEEVPDWKGKDAGGDAGDQNYGGGTADWDGKYIDTAKQWLTERAQGDNADPFVMVVSLINPHDVLAYNSDSWNASDDHGGYPDEEGWLNAGIESLPPTVHEVKSLNSKPRVQTLFQAASQRQQEIQTTEEQKNYLNFYANLVKTADDQMGEILEILRGNQDLFADTMIVSTTDHGEMSMAHGGMTQKMFNAYEESVNIPMTFSNPYFFGSEAKVSDALVSHVDFLPTVASFMDLDSDLIRRSDLRGVDYSSILKAAAEGNGDWHQLIDVQDDLLFTYDDIWFGNDPSVGLPNSEEHGSLPGRNRVQSIFTKHYKYNRYYEQDYNRKTRTSETWNADSPWFAEFYDITPGGEDYFYGGRVDPRYAERYAPTPLELRNIDPVFGGYQPSPQQKLDSIAVAARLQNQVDERLQPIYGIDPTTGESVIVTSQENASAPVFYRYNGGIEYASDQDLEGQPSDAYGKNDVVAQFFDLDGENKILEVAFTTRFGNVYQVIGRRDLGAEIQVFDVYVGSDFVNYQSGSPDVLGTNGPTVQYRLVPDNFSLDDIGIAWTGGDPVWLADA